MKGGRGQFNVETWFKKARNCGTHARDKKGRTVKEAARLPLGKAKSETESSLAWKKSQGGAATRSRKEGGVKKMSGCTTKLSQ